MNALIAAEECRLARYDAINLEEILQSIIPNHHIPLLLGSNVVEPPTCAPSLDAIVQSRRTPVAQNNRNLRLLRECIGPRERKRYDRNRSSESHDQKRPRIRTKKFAGSFASDTAFATYIPAIPRSRPSPTSVRQVSNPGIVEDEYWRSPSRFPTSHPRPASTNATALGFTLNVAPRTRMPLRLKMSNNSETSSCLYSSCASASRSR